MADMLIVIAYELSGSDVPRDKRLTLHRMATANVGSPIDLPPGAWQDIAFAAKMEFARQCRKQAKSKRTKEAT